MKFLKPLLTGLVFSGLVCMQSCEHDESVDREALEDLAFDNADAINGGRLYDKFWATENYDGPADATVQQSDIEDFPDFYRCKQCHGWDLKARFGAYVNRGPKTTRPNVSEVALWEYRENAGNKELFLAIQHKGGAAIDPARTEDGTNPSLGGDFMPDYAKILTLDQTWDLVKFIKEGALDTELLYDLNVSGAYPTGSRTFTNLGKDGDSALGDAYYASKCASCHGADGTDIIIDGTLTLGKFTREKPYEFQHKTKFGNPDGYLDGMIGTSDATVEDLKNLLKALNDNNKYPDQAGSQGPISYSINIQPFFDGSCISCHGGSSPVAGLNLETGVSYGNLINGGFINTTTPTSSLLYTKLNGSMAQYSTASDTQMVLQWIEEGALNN